MPSRRLARFAWAVLGWNLLVVLWGAYVRASGSGAGCGAHWPLCNGVVVPRAPELATLIEFTHRLTSGVAGLLVLGLAAWAWRITRPGAALRRAALASLVFMVTEALLGAALVKFELVASDDSLTRAFSLGAHLVNTFLLLAALAVTGWLAAGGAAPRPALAPRRARAIGLLLAGVLLVGVTGAITALGDTLFPATSVAEGLRQDLSPTSHLLLRLRVWHPALALAVGAGVIALPALLGPGVGLAAGRLARGAAALVGVQWLVGAVNIVLLAPTALQLVHLLLADLVWIALVLAGCAALAAAPAVEPAAPREPAAAAALAGR